MGWGVIRDGDEWVRMDSLVNSRWTGWLDSSNQRSETRNLVAPRCLLIPPEPASPSSAPRTPTFPTPRAPSSAPCPLVSQEAPALQTLIIGLWTNQVGAEGARGLAALKNAPGLRTLSLELGRNKVRDEGACALAGLKDAVSLPVPRLAGFATGLRGVLPSGTGDSQHRRGRT